MSIFSKFKIVFIIFLLIFGCLMFIFKKNSSPEYFITAKFQDSGPLYNQMPVFYKGCRIGRVKEIKLDKDYKNTLVKIVFAQKPKLPEDITAKVRKFDVRECIDLKSDESDEGLLKNGSEIDGEAAFDMQTFLSEIADADLLIPLMQAASDALDSFRFTTDKTGVLVSTLNVTVQENRRNINKTTKNLAQMSKSLDELSASLNGEKGKFKSTLSNADKSSENILKTTENIKAISKNIDDSTKNLDKTMSKIDETVEAANATAKNTKEITGNFRDILGSRFAGFKLFFGKSRRCCRN